MGIIRKEDVHSSFDDYIKEVVDYDSTITSLNEKVNKTDIVNNLSTTDVGYGLDARQGKAINDKLSLIGSTEKYVSTIVVPNASATIPTNISSTRQVLGSVDNSLTFLRDTDGRIIFNKSGMYLITFYCMYDINSNGIRRILFNEKQYFAEKGHAENEIVGVITIPCYIPPGAQTIPIKLFQNCGSNLNCTTEIYITKLN